MNKVKKQNKQTKNQPKKKGWRGHSAVKITGYSSRVSGFSPQHLYNGSQPFINSSSRNSEALSILTSSDIHAFRQNTKIRQK